MNMISPNVANTGVTTVSLPTIHPIYRQWKDYGDPGSCINSLIHWISEFCIERRNTLQNQFICQQDAAFKQLIAAFRQRQCAIRYQYASGLAKSISEIVAGGIGTPGLTLQVQLSGSGSGV